MVEKCEVLMEKKIVLLCSKDIDSLANIDADYIVVYDRSAEISVSELSAISSEMAEKDGVCAAISPGGLGAKLNSIIYSVAAGKAIPVPAGAVGFSRETAVSLAGARKFDPVSLIMESAERGIPTTNIQHKSSGKIGFFKLVSRWWSLFLSSHILKYIFSSVVAFAVDYVLLLLLTDLLGGILPKLSMEVAALLAWITSSLTNFAINRSFVFRSKAPLLTALGEYYGLAVVVFLLKTYVILELLTRVLFLPLGIAKPIAEVVFFITNYFIQKKLIFKKR